MAEDDFLPTLVGYRTSLLEHEGIGLDLQIAITAEDQLNRRFHGLALAMSPAVAMDLAAMLVRTVEMLRPGHEPLQ